MLISNYKIIKSNIDGLYHHFALHNIWMQQPRTKTNSFKVHSTFHCVDNQSDFLTKDFSL